MNLIEIQTHWMTERFLPKVNQNTKKKPRSPVVSKVNSAPTFCNANPTTDWKFTDFFKIWRGDRNQYKYDGRE